MTGLWSRSTLVAIIGIAAVSLIVAIALTVLGGDITPRGSTGTDGYSVSAIGHRGLVELLQRLDVPVVVSRGASADKAKDGLLVVAEPKLSALDASHTKLRPLLTSVPRSLLVLPKWYGTPKPNSRWVESVGALPADEIASIVSGLDGEGHIDRDVAPRQWTLPDWLPAPQLPHGAQTLAGMSDLEPVVVAGNRLLLGKKTIAGSEIWVLTDPDLINNAGLATPENARFAVALLDQLRDDGPVVFDETIHGYQRQPSLVRVLFRFPLLLATLQVLFCAIIAVWAAMVRFGPRRAAPPPIAPGKDYLIRNTAALLRYGGHHADALRRYLALNIQTVRHALHAPEGLSQAATTAWLERIRLLRGGTVALPDLEHEIAAAPRSPQRLIELADLVHRWRMEMMHGSHHRS